MHYPAGQGFLGIGFQNQRSGAGAVHHFAVMHCASLIMVVHRSMIKCIAKSWQCMAAGVSASLSAMHIPDFPPIF
jgi:hypothetical protein